MNYKKIAICSCGALLFFDLSVGYYCKSSIHKSLETFCVERGKLSDDGPAKDYADHNNIRMLSVMSSGTTLSNVSINTVPIKLT